jgi:hypothetical protein
MSKNITADQGITIGLDLGDKHTQCCSLDELGEVEETFRVRSTGPGLSKRFGGMAPRAGSSWRWAHTRLG